MALGNNAYTMLQAEQQARADQLAATPMTLPLQQRLQNSGVLPMIGGGAMTAARGFDDFVLGGATGSMINSGRNLVGGTTAHPTQTDFPVFPGALGKAGVVANTAAKGVPKMLPKLGARLAPVGAAIPVGSVGQASPQPDVMGAQVFGPAAAQAAAPQAAMPQAAIAAEALEKVNAEDEAEKPAQRSTQPARPAIPPTPQQRQEAMAQAFASPETLQAVAEATTAPDGKGEPIKKKRKGFTPENMGLIAFGLTLMSGGDFDDALNNGLALHGTLDGMRDEKEQKAASEELLKSVPPEYVPALNALIASKQFDKVAEYGLGIQQDEAAAEAANAQRLGLVQQAASVLGVSPDAISMMPADKLAQMVVNRFDTQDTMQINAQKAQIEASKQAALDGDKSAGIEFLAAYGVDATNLPEKAINKQIEKLSVGQFSQGESNAAGHAYIMASVIPRLEYLEENEWDPVTGFKTNRAAQAEYDQLLDELALAINRKDSGAAISIPEKKEVRALYGFKLKATGGAAAANAAAQKQRRNKYEAIKGQAGLALPYMMVNNPIIYDDDVLAGGVSLGVETGFTPTRYSTNPLGIEFEGVE